MSDAIEIPTLAGTLDELAGRGFTEHFIMVNGKLRGADSGKVFPAEEVMISEYHRFEGVSDPDDMAILYAIETRSGLRGTLADAFGVYADPVVEAFMREVVLRRR
ncbi:MAG TPA: phosphoribosylpyrophosphate synthetase [Candidatus Binatia bacterium]|nr:phosphoribosylpyrophosphate synthetase [Candidatus Binatia bacterium]